MELTQIVAHFFGQIKLNLISLNGVNDLIVDFLMSSSMGRDWIPVHQDQEINSLSTGTLFNY